MHTRVAENVNEPTEAPEPAPARRTVIPPGLMRRLNRPRSPAGPLLLYLFLALAMMYPFFPAGFRGVGDLYAVVGSTVEAKNALLEGQFPIRVPPNQLDDTRYPIFQFYGNFPYTLSGIIHLILPANVYAAWKVTAVLMLVFGAYYAYRFAHQLTRRAVAATVAGAVFMTSPYMFADLGARGAYTEFVAFNLMPAVMFYAWRAFVSPKLRYIFLSAILWALLGLSHNISYLYGVLFGGLFFLSMIRFDSKYFRRLLRVTAAGVLSVAMVLYYVVPQFTVLNDLMIKVGKPNPNYWAFLTTLKNLLSPVAYTDPQSSTANLTLQVGLPLLVLVPLALVSIPFQRRSRHRWMILRLFVLFALAFFIVWTPFNFWDDVPELLLFAQFPYRILLFLVVFGAALSAYGAAFVGGRRLEWADLGKGRWVVIATLALVGFAGLTYIPADRIYDRQTIPKQTRDPEMGGLEDYLLTTLATARTGTFHPDVNFAGWEFGLTRNGHHYRLPGDHWLVRPTTVYFPTPQEASALVVEGELPDKDINGEEIKDNKGKVEFIVKIGERRHSTFITPGPFKLVAPLEAPPNGEPLQVVIDTLVLDFQKGHRSTIARLNRIALEPPAPVPEGRIFVPAASIKSQVRYGKHTRLNLTLDRPALVQLPVIHYSKLLSVRVDGRGVDYGNLGRFVAVPVEAGAHSIDVVFTGVRWANWVSLLGWVVAVGGLGFLAIRRSRLRASASASPASRPAGPIFGLRELAGSIAILVLGASAAWAAPHVGRYFDGKLRFEVSANSNYSKEQSAEFAFDGDRGTFWAAQGSNPATLTILPSRPAKLQRIEFDSRETGLLEQWHHVKVSLFRNGRKVLEQEFPFPDAHREPAHAITLPPTEADKIELHFSEPVVITRDDRRLEPSAVSPGYREIRLAWEGEEVAK